MTLLIITQYLHHKWPRIGFVCRNHKYFLSSFTTYHQMCNKSNSISTTSGAGHPNPSEAPEFTPDFCGLGVVQSLVFCVVFCRSLCVLISFSFWTLCWLSSSIYIYFLPVELWESSRKSVHFLLTENVKRRQSRASDNCIILLINLIYDRWCIILIFLKDKHNINAVCLKILKLCVFGAKLWKWTVNLVFI
jgi:hypothetical protein